MPDKKILLFVIYIFFCAVLADAEESHVFSDADDLLCKFSESRENMNSFVIKAEIKDIYTYPGFEGKGRSYKSCEYRYDGNRCKNTELIWGDINLKERNVKKENADYFSKLWDGKAAYTYINDPLHDNSCVVISKEGDPASVIQECSESFKYTPAGEIMGYHWGNDTPLDELFVKSSKTLQLQKQTSNIRGAECYVIDAYVPGRGQYTVWIDPVHDFHITRIQVLRKTGDRIFNQTVRKDAVSKELYEVLEFQQIDGKWFPKTCNAKHINSSADYYSSQESEITFTQVNLNPDHEKLGSFLTNDIPNGTKVLLRALSPDIEFIWEDGNVIRKADKDSMGKNETSTLVTPDPKELLAHFAKTQDHFKSFTAKTEVSSRSATKSLNPQFPNSRQEVQREIDFRFDLNHQRTNKREYFYGKMHPTMPAVPKDDPWYRSNLCVSHQFNRWYGRASKADPGHGTLSKKNDSNSQNTTIQALSRAFQGHEAFGYLYGSDKRIDEIFQNAPKIQLSPNMQKASGVDCYVIKAIAPEGKFTLWIDPEHGYNLAKAQCTVEQGDRLYETIAKKGHRYYTCLDNVKYEQIDDIWVPIQAEILYEWKQPGSYNYQEEIQFKVQEMQINPDHDALGSFKSDDIPNGALFTMIDNTGILEGAYHWQDGKLIPVTNAEKAR